AMFELERAEARAHILEGLVKAQDRIGDVIKAGRASSSREQFESVLQGREEISGVKPFDFTEAQSKAIAERRLYQLSRLDVEKVKNEHEELKVRISDLRDIISSMARRLNILVKELETMVEKHGDERRSLIDPMPLSMDREDLIEERAIVISLSEDNYIRHMPVEACRVQNRGGKGLRGVTTKDEDFPKSILTCFSKDRLLIFTDQGRVYGLRAWETPSASRYGRGTHIRNLLGGIRDEEKVISILPLNRDLINSPEGHFLIFATKNGRIKRSYLSEYVKINRNGKYALRFADGEEDSLVSVRPATEEDHVVIVSARGNACRFKPAEIKKRLDPSTGMEQTTHLVRVQGRVSQGVSGMKLGTGDKVIGMIVTEDFDTSVLTISKHGMAKRSRLGSGEMVSVVDETTGEESVDENGELVIERDGYRRTNRGTKGVRTMSLDKDDEIVAVKQIPDIKDQLFILTSKGMMIRMASEQTKETLGKVTKGTRIMELRNPDRNGYSDEVIFVARLPSSLVDMDVTEEE
ncbi:MAG: DNA gyrase C-terminal beta-propeller domain-containing protein, partial [Candidatus Thermoplasmatota archaeon]|nr:DNA gyrase C-terminal beta-propeller domain-containing protein [Candidatus Thermoplasmatota archaeon]